MAERKRDYHAEYERRKANGWVRPPRDSKEEYAKRKEKEKRWGIALPNDDAVIFTSLLARLDCKSPNEFIRKIINGDILVFPRNKEKSWHK